MNVEGATHKQVVDLIKSGGDVLTLTVISVTQQVRIIIFIKGKEKVFTENDNISNIMSMFKILIFSYNLIIYQSISNGQRFCMLLLP